uniref:Uncharacterized protein n=1 Tax=Anguilla anguilla TaxID=7936 RepID=A0A0E9RQZ3_ANGAN
MYLDSDTVLVVLALYSSTLEI